MSKVVHVTDPAKAKPISQSEYDKEVRKGNILETKKDFRQELTDKFVAALEEGKIPWQRPWNEVATPLSPPRNAISEQQYKGGNRLILTLTQMDRNYPDPRWLTFNQAKELGGSVAKGEKGMQIEFWREKPFFERKDVEVKMHGTPVQILSEKDGIATTAGGGQYPTSLMSVHHDGKEYGWGQAERRLNTLVAQTHTIFNVQQCKDLNIEPLAPAPESKLPMHERGELLIEGMKKDGVRFVEAPNRAFYRSASDTISLPPREHFTSEAAYYGTALHESAHATGNENRLNRNVGKNEFGSEGYAKEELVAEMTSAFLAAETGIPHDVEDHKAYIQSWTQALKNDKNEIFRAAKLADQAANYMHDKAHEAQLEKAAQAMSIEMPGLDGLSNSDITLGSYKPFPDSRVYVEHGLISVDSNEEGRIVSFGSSKALEEAASEFGLSGDDIKVAHAIEYRQKEALRLSREAGDRFDGIETPEEAQARNAYREAEMPMKQCSIPDEELDKKLAEIENRIQASERANSKQEPEPELEYGR